MATMLKPKARLCPARSERASISRASGSWAAKVFSRRLRRNSSHTSGSEPMQQAGQRHQRRVDAARTTARAIPTARQHRRDHRQLADGQVGVGLLEQQVDVAEPLERTTGTMPGLVVQRLGEDAGFFAAPSLAAAARWRRSAGRGGLRSCCPARLRSSRPPRPPARRRPQTPASRNQQRDSRL